MHPGSFAAEKDFSVFCILCSLLSLSFAFSYFLFFYITSNTLIRCHGCAGAFGGNSWPTLPYDKGDTTGGIQPVSICL